MRAGIKAFLDGTLHICCGECREVFTEDVPSSYSPEWSDEFGEFENYQTQPCPNCQAQGKTVVQIVNMNLPPEAMSEYDNAAPVELRNSCAFVRQMIERQIPQRGDE